MSLLGIDVGTTAVKVLLSDSSGGTLMARRGYPLDLPGPDQVEQDPEQVWAETKGAVREIVKTAGLKAGSLATSISSQGATLIPLDGKWSPLGKAIVWMDHRAKAQARRLVERFGRDFFYLKTGWQLSNCLPFLQICWLRDESPRYFQQIEKFAFVGDYVTYKLCGEWATDPSSASITQLYNLQKGEWDEELLELAGVSESQLPPVRDSGCLLGEVSSQLREELGLPGGTVVVNGAHDQYCASLGSGSLLEGDLTLSGGTAWVLLLNSDKPVFDVRSYLAPGRHVIPGKWGLMSSLPAAGAGVRWLGEAFGKHVYRGFDEGSFYESIEREAGSISPGSEGLFFVPHFLGSTAPTWQSSSKAAILGLSLHHQPAHLFRALLEGIGYEVAWNVETFRDLGIEPRSVCMTGGASRSALWPQIISDILGMPIRIPRIQEAACIGAAAIAAVGSGSSPNYREAVDAIAPDSLAVYPDEERSERYREILPSYKDLFWKVSGGFETLC